MAAKKKKRAGRFDWLSSRPFKVLYLIIALVLIFLARDYNGIRLGITGVYVWLLAMSTFFAAGLIYLSLFTLPLEGQEGWYEALRIVVEYYFRTPLKIIRSFGPRRFLVPAISAAAQKRLSASFKQLRAGFVPSHYAVAIAKGASFTRADGPGYVKLDRMESINQAIDLRQHLRRLPVKAMSRDGIPLDTNVSVLFQVRQVDAETAEPRVQYPYDQQAVFDVNYWGNLEGGKSHLSWSERIVREAADALVAELSRHTLDELYYPDESGAPPVERIKGRLKRQLSDTFNRYGIVVYNVGVSQFKVPEQVTQQRIDNWQADWQRRIFIERAGGDTEAYRQIKLADARAQIDIIHSITESIEAMNAEPNADLTEVIVLRLIKAMEDAVKNDTVQALVPQNVFNAVQQIAALVDEGENGA